MFTPRARSVTHHALQAHERSPVIAETPIRNRSFTPQTGLRYPDFHATAISAPSRGALLTGRNSASVREFDFSHTILLAGIFVLGRVPAEGVTIAGILPAVTTLTGSAETRQRFQRQPAANVSVSRAWIRLAAAHRVSCCVCSGNKRSLSVLTTP